MNNLKPLIVVSGPTASGKTGMALALAKKFDGELINADSRQIYKEMNIATNKIADMGMKKTESESETVYSIDGVPLYLLDLIPPDEIYSLTDYKKAALQKIHEVQEKGKLPILVGGTGLYLSAIVDNLVIPQGPPDGSLREAMETEPTEKLFAQLQAVDLVAAETIGPQNKRKIIRALEVYKLTGKPFSAQQKKGKPLFDILQIGIKIEREELYAKIDERVDKMIEQGLVEETSSLTKKYDAELPAMSGIGYKEISSYLRNELTLAEAVQQIKYHTHQYARRQLTWFRRDSRIKWLTTQEQAEQLVETFIK